MKVNKDMLHYEFSKAWADDRMINYCTNKAATMAILPDGGIITVDKQSIVKDFCFGESGYDYDEAQHSCWHAMNDQGYFFRQNMKCFNDYIESLKECRDENGGRWLHITDIHYTGQKADCKIRSFQFARTCEVLEETGPAFLRELFGKQVKIRGIAGHIATPEEVDAVLKAYEEAAADHEKKVRSYLKRYGTSKVNAWTYWRDA